MGASTLAAGGLASITFMTLIGVMGAVVMAVTPLIAETDGVGNKHQVTTITTQGFWLVGMITIPFCIIVANLDRLLIALGQNPTTVILADSIIFKLILLSHKRSTIFMYK